MANLTLSAVFDAVYQLETTDPVLGGVGGIANRQGQELGNRTEWLKTKLENAGLTGDAREFTGDVFTINESGFYRVPASATNLPTAQAGVIVAICRTVSSVLYRGMFFLSGATKTLVYAKYDAAGIGGPWARLEDNIDAAARIGVIETFARNTAPTNYLVCDGSAISRSLYQTLFNIIGTTFGAGDGSTTFNLPDLRGEFERGWDNGRGVDVGRVFGSAQADEIKAHTHTKGVQTEQIDFGGTGTTSQGVAALVDTGITGGVETRPRNIALLKCIKFQ